MKMRLRRTAALAMTLLLLGLLVPGPGRAAGTGVYFTAANEQLMDLNSETMPFYSNGVLYVSSQLFEGGELGLSYGRNTNLGLATLYRQGSNLDLRFDIAGQIVYDKQYNMYNGYAIERGGMVFFPLELVCRYFRLSWSYSETNTVPLIRVTSDSVILSDTDFINAAATLMQGRYDDYERASSVRPPAFPDPPVTPDPPVQAAEGQKVYLIFDGAYAREILPTLGDIQGTFLLTAGEMADGDLLRALVAGGHAPVLRLQGETSEDRAEELRQGREALWQTACCWLELAWYDGEEHPLLDGEGFQRVQAKISASGEEASGLLRAVGQYRGDVAVYWGESGRPEVLRGVLEALRGARYRLSAWRLTA